ncbi:MAG: iron-sulfur cluster assembly protein [Actinomycetota bacterium]|jgi:metal-sulfur cluster biosynthetic enzyme
MIDAQVTEAQVTDALSAVRDPELDEPITDLGFVKEVRIDGGQVTVTLWLPTYFCAPNFAYIMAVDAKSAVGALDGVTDVAIRLIDHHASDEINGGLAAGKDFDETFPGETAGNGLAEVRLRFDRKAFVARQQEVYRQLAERGVTPEDILRLTLADLPDTPEARRYLDRRARVGVDTSGTAPFLVDLDGQAITAETLDRHLLFARTVSVSIEGNASFCRGLLAARYGLTDTEAKEACS